MAAFGGGCIWTTTWPCSVVQQEEYVRVIFFGKKSGYTVVKSHYCRDLRFLTSGHPRFRTVFFSYFVGSIYGFEDVF